MNLWFGVFRELAIILAPLLCFLFAFSESKEKPGGALASEEQNTIAIQLPHRGLSLSLHRNRR